MSEIQLIKDLTTAFGPSGFEEDVVKVLKKYLKDFNVEIDSMNNLFANMKNLEDKSYTILLDAHTDEVGFMVQNIFENGTLSFVPLGGWIPSNIPAHLVGIKNAHGEIIEGITGSTPPHFMTLEERNKPLSIDTMFIDIGAKSRKEVLHDFGINIGSPIAPLVDFKFNPKKHLIRGKAFDNRLGCACIVETMKKLQDNKELNINIVGGFATQEEVGMRGAKITSRKVKPDLAIVFEGSPADDLYFPKGEAQGALGGGVQLRHMDQSYIANSDYIKFAKKIAEQNHIKYQSTVRRAGSTNAGVIHLADEGVPVLVLGIPSRYVHSHYNFSDIKDFHSTVDLAVKLIESLDEKELKKILKI